MPSLRQGNMILISLFRSIIILNSTVPQDPFLVFYSALMELLVFVLQHVICFCTTVFMYCSVLLDSKGVFNFILMCISLTAARFHPSAFLRYCVTDFSGDPLVRPLQHSDCVQQAWAKLP